MTHWTQVIFQLCIKALAIVEEIFTIEPSRKLQINLFQLNLIIPLKKTLQLDNRESFRLTCPYKSNNSLFHYGYG